MNFLIFLEGIRNPFLNKTMEVITFLGYEGFSIVLAFFIHWCVDKKRGYFLLNVGFFGLVINQFLKFIFRIPRPWILNKNFTIVESARDEAIGYSFPSGHTQNITGSMGTVIATTKRNWVRILGVISIILVAFSRMYLGVHTPKDVITSLVIGILLVIIFYPFFKNDNIYEKAMPYICVLGILLSVSYIIFLKIYPFPADIDISNLTSGVEIGYKILGASLAIALGYFLDTKYIKFKNEAAPLGQVLKLFIGMFLTLGLKAFLKATVLKLGVFGEGLEYFLTVLFATAIWPLTFKFFSKIGGKKNA